MKIFGFPVIVSDDLPKDMAIVFDDFKNWAAARNIGNEMKTIYLLTTGDGSDGNEWGVQGIYSTREKAEKAQQKYAKPQKNIYGDFYTRESEIEEWELDPE